MQASRIRSLVTMLVMLCVAGFANSPHSTFANSLSILAADYQLNRIGRYDAATGASLGTFALVHGPNEMLLGPDGKLYVTSVGTVIADPHSIIRFDPASGQNLGVFASGPSLRGFDFGPNGNLFAADVNSGSIMEFDGQTGASLGTFISGLNSPIAVRFGPSGDMYVARGHHESSSTYNVLRFDGLTGASKGVFASIGMQNPQNLLFGPEGDLYVANQRVTLTGIRNVTRYDGVTGALDSSFVVSGSRINSQGLAFLPSGELLVGSGGNSIRRYDATTGAFIDDFIQGGLFFGGVVLVPEPSTYVMAAMGLVVLLVARRRKLRRMQRDLP